MRIKNQNKSIIQRISKFTGVCLIVIAIIVLVSWQVAIHLSKLNADFYVKSICDTIDLPQGTVPEERKDNTMPILSVDGVDFVGLLEIPKYDSILPVCDDWGEVTKYPCKFSGSVYNRTMQIGSTSQKGQYDFYKELCVGDTVIFTDMESKRYTYNISGLRYDNDVDQTSLTKENAALTLFIKNIYDFQYLIVSCEISK